MPTIPPPSFEASSRIQQKTVDEAKPSVPAAPATAPAVEQGWAAKSGTSAAPPGSGSKFEALEEIAKNSLAHNLHKLGGETYLTAGAHQFKSLWTRDFAWSARGLIDMGRADVVLDQVTMLLDNLQPGTNLLPRTLDTMDAKFRVALATLHQLLPFIPGELGISGKLKPEYIDQHGQQAFDGNMLAVLAGAQYAKATGDTAWWKTHTPQLKQALEYYKPFLKNGLLSQPPFSDWQDSVKREGPTFYSNMLYAQVLDQVADDPAFGVKRTDVTALKARIESTFKDPQTGLYRSEENGPQISLDGNLLAIDLGYLPKDGPEARQLFEALKKSPLWNGAEGPGFTTFPNYSEADKAGMVKAVGIGGYHDTLYWSWEMALAAKVAGQLGDHDSANAIMGKLDAMAKRDGVIGEVYEPKPGLPLEQTLLYKSETPFSWGSAFVLDAAQSLDKDPEEK